MSSALCRWDICPCLWFCAVRGPLVASHGPWGRVSRGHHGGDHHDQRQSMGTVFRNRCSRGCGHRGVSILKGGRPFGVDPACSYFPPMVKPYGGGGVDTVTGSPPTHRACTPPMICFGVPEVWPHPVPVARGALRSGSAYTHRGHFYRTAGCRFFLGLSVSALVAEGCRVRVVGEVPLLWKRPVCKCCYGHVGLPSAGEGVAPAPAVASTT